MFEARVLIYRVQVLELERQVIAAEVAEADAWTDYYNTKAEFTDVTTHLFNKPYLLRCAVGHCVRACVVQGALSLGVDQDCMPTS